MGFCVGANGEVTISDERAKHILEGDGPGKPGGGHRPGTGKPGKSEFPSGWSDEKIIDSVVGVANDSSSSRGPRQGNGNVPVRGTRDGVDIEVIVNPGNNTIVTGYPTNVSRNPR